jgi:arylsulfatase A-like enzyme
LEDIYDHDVAFTDRELGRLIATLDAKRGRPTGLVVTADHGESFIGGLPVHGVELHEESIRIPLLVRGPGVLADVSDAPASLVDVAPTVFEWTQTPPPPRMDGGSLVHPDPGRMPISDVWRHDRGGHVYIDETGAAGATRRLVIDRLSNAVSVYAVGDISRPAHVLAERPDPRMTALLGRYQEEMGALER